MRDASEAPRRQLERTSTTFVSDCVSAPLCLIWQSHGTLPRRGRHGDRPRGARAIAGPPTRSKQSGRQAEAQHRSQRGQRGPRRRPAPALRRGQDYSQPRGLKLEPVQSPRQAGARPANVLGHHGHRPAQRLGEASEFIARVGMARDLVGSYDRG